MTELVIFDCDGVLVDSEPISCRVMAEALTEEGLPYSTEEIYRDFMGRAWDDSLRMIEERLGRATSEGFTDRFRAARDAALAEEVTAIPGVRDAIAALDTWGIRRCVASSGAHEKIRLTLGATGLLELFDGAIFSATDPEVASGKPAPDLFLHAASAMGVDPGACTVVEDTPVGIRAARAAGMRALAFVDNAPHEALEAAGAHAAFERMDELPTLVADR